MSSDNETMSAVKTIGKQIFEMYHAESTPEQPFLEFLDYRETVKALPLASNVDEYLASCAIEICVSV